MNALIAILLLLFIPAVMSIMRLTRLTTKFLWMAALLGALASWGLIFAARFNLPAEIAPQTWQPVSLLPLSPALRVDELSWPMAMALATLLLAVVLTSAARLERRGLLPPAPQPALENMPNPVPPAPQTSQGAYWKAWAANLALTGLGLVAVLAGNMLTLLLAWAALDIVEVLILLGQAATSLERGQVVRAFSARLGGVGALLLAGIAAWGQGVQFDFDTSSSLAILFMLAAAGIRLGILPIIAPSLSELPMRIGLGTISRLVPVASSLVLLVRSSSTGVQGTAGLVLLGFAALTGLIGGVGWLRAQDALAGRPYWILAVASLAMAAAILGQPWACLAWSLVALLPGGLLFLSSIKRRYMLVIGLFGVLSLTGLPFSPAWSGTSLFQMASSTDGLIIRVLTVLLGLVFFVVHVLLIIGYANQVLRSSTTPPEEQQAKVDRWVWLLYIPGLACLPVIHWVLSWISLRATAEIPLVMWVEGAVASAAAVGLLVYTSRAVREKRPSLAERRWGSSGQIYLPLVQFLAWFFRQVALLINVITAMLEGQAGILWAFVLLVLALAFLQQG